MSSTAAEKAGSLAFEGLVEPLILRTNWREAARISASVTGGSKLKRGLMLRHIPLIRASERGGAQVAGFRSQPNRFILSSDIDWRPPYILNSI